ncbi:unnamed protein product, partial [Prorocentrum cordatum]
MSRQLCRDHAAVADALQPFVTGPKWLEYGAAPGQDAFDSEALNRVKKHWKDRAAVILLLVLLRRRAFILISERIQAWEDWSQEKRDQW